MVTFLVGAFLLSLLLCAYAVYWMLTDKKRYRIMEVDVNGDISYWVEYAYGVSDWYFRSSHYTLEEARAAVDAAKDKDALAEKMKPKKTRVI